MKRCPECYEAYDAGESFCETDGQRLLADPTFSIVPEESPLPVQAQPNPDVWLMAVVGIFVGILISAAAYLAISLWSFDSSPQGREPTVYASKSQPVSSRALPARVGEEAVEPTEELAEDPEADANDELPADPAQTLDNPPVAARLNTGPVSTSERVKDSAEVADVRTIIQMNDGTTMEVDAAWQEKQGVWYRRGGLVSFVESQRVKMITARAEPKASSSEAVVP
jgi:hypothetical protein